MLTIKLKKDQSRSIGENYPERSEMETSVSITSSSLSDHHLTDTIAKDAISLTSYKLPDSLFELY